MYPFGRSGCIIFVLYELMIIEYTVDMVRLTSESVFIEETQKYKIISSGYG